MLHKSLCTSFMHQTSAGKSLTSKGMGPEASDASASLDQRIGLAMPLQVRLAPNFGRRGGTVISKHGNAEIHCALGSGSGIHWSIAVSCLRFTRLKRPYPMTARTEIDLQPSSMTAHEAPVRAANITTKQAPPVDFTGHGTILLVEDEVGLRALIARGLRSRGFGVIEASDGLEALEALEQKNGAVARGIAQLIRMGWFRPVHAKSIASQEVHQKRGRTGRRQPHPLPMSAQPVHRSQPASGCAHLSFQETRAHRRATNCTPIDWRARD